MWDKLNSQVLLNKNTCLCLLFLEVSSWAHQSHVSFSIRVHTRADAPYIFISSPAFNSFVPALPMSTITQPIARNPCIRFFLLLKIMSFIHLSHADVGNAAHYRPPYLPTACYSTDASQLRGNSMFASAGEGIWDNGAACGRQYLVRCISAAEKKTCVPGRTIQIRIVDRALTSVSRPSKPGVTMVLSNAAFAAIANPSAPSINIEFQEF